MGSAELSGGGMEWRAVFDACPLPISVVDVHGNQVYGNPAYAAYLGYTLDELVELDVSTLTRESDRAWTASYLRRLRNGELDRFSTMKTYVRKDGTYVTGMLTSQPVITDGECTALIGTITPVERPMPFAEGRLRKLIEHVSDTVTLVDADGKVLDTSGRYTPILGYPREFWEERTLFDLVPAEDLPVLEAMRLEVFARPGDVVNGEIHLRNAFGEMDIVAISAVNLLDDEDIGGIVLTTRNITPLRTLIDDLSRSRDEAVAEAELRSRLVATVSHELRNPLHAVLGLSELLAGGEAPNTEELAGVLHRQVEDLARIVDDLLTTSRLEAVGVTIEPAPMDVRSVIDDLVAIHAGTAAPGVQVRGWVAEGVPATVMVDPVRLRQLVANLLGNAVKFTTAGSVEVDVWVTDGLLHVTVADTGTGIAEDQLGRVFEPFVNGGQSGAGAGLGLSIVRRIVDAMNGTLQMESTLGRGTRVSLSLPLGTDSAGVAAEPGVAPAEPQGVGPLPSARVLVVEDNVVNQQLATAQLEMLGHSCTVVGSGTEALVLLADPATPPFDIVLMDFHLPGIDGIETTRRIRQWEQDTGRRRLPIIGVTASATLGDRQSSLAADMDDHVAKPVRLGELERVLLMWRQPAPAAAVTGTHADPRPDSLIEQTVDLATLDELVEEMDDRGVIEQIVRTYLGELDRRVEGIIAADHAGDVPRRRLLVHTLGSSSRAVGAYRLASLTEHYPDHADEAAVRSMAAGVAAALQQWLNP